MKEAIQRIVELSSVQTLSRALDAALRGLSASCAHDPIVASDAQDLREQVERITDWASRERSLASMELRTLRASERAE